MCLCSVFALLGGNRQSRAPRFPLPVRFQIIRVGDFHQVGGPPGEIFRLDEMVTLNGFHELSALLTSMFGVGRYASPARTVRRFPRSSILLTHHQCRSAPAQRPVIASSFSGYRAPSTLILDEAPSISRRSSGVSSTKTAPMFSSRRCSFVVPGIGTIHGF